MSINDVVLCAFGRAAPCVSRLPGTIAAFSFLGAVLSLAGCGGGEKLPTVPVTGVVTYNGSPLEGATVSFMTKELDAKAASGTTDSSGHFTLQTYISGTKMYPGAIPGEYQVTVSKRESSLPGGMHPGQAGFDMEKLQDEAAAAAPQGGGPPQGGPPGRGGPPPANMSGMARGAAFAGKLVVPEKYTDPTKSGFTATVKPSGNEPFSFELKDE